MVKKYETLTTHESLQKSVVHEISATVHTDLQEYFATSLPLQESCHLLVWPLKR